MLPCVSRNKSWVGQANCGPQVSDKQGGKQDFLLMSCLSFLCIIGDKGEMKICSSSACSTRTSECLNQCSASLLSGKLKANWSEEPPPPVVRKPIIKDAGAARLQGRTVRDTCTVLLGDRDGTTPWKTEGPKNHCKFQKAHY